MLIQIFINILIYTCLYSLVAFSFQLIFRLFRFFHFDHAIAIALGPYLTYYFHLSLELNFFLSVIFALAGTSAIMLLIYYLVYSNLLKKEATSWQLLIVSLGIYIIFQNIISMMWGDNIRSFRTWPIETGTEVFGVYLIDEQLIIVGISLVILVFFWAVISKSSIWKRIEAVSSNNTLSEIFGINTIRTGITGYIIGSVIASLSGILIAFDSDMTPVMGFQWLLYGVIVMIIGGLGSIKHLFLSALLLATAQNLTAYYLSNRWMNATAFIILIIFLAWRPYGFSGHKIKKVDI